MQNGGLIMGYLETQIEEIQSFLEQQEEKYRKIVAFHDGNNVKRLISMLKADGLLS